MIRRPDRILYTILSDRETAFPFPDLPSLGLRATAESIACRSVGLVDLCSAKPAGRHLNPGVM
jgi:hypothetical protein